MSIPQLYLTADDGQMPQSMKGGTDECFAAGMYDYASDRKRGNS